MPDKEKTRRDPLVLFHQDLDGFTAAWCANQAFQGKAELVAVTHGDPPPKPADVLDRVVLVFDFSWHRDDIESMHKLASSLTLFDHHKTAEKELGDLRYCHFSRTESACVMAWRHFFPGRDVPDWIFAIEDRDLWRFQRPTTRAIHAYLMSHTMTTENWSAVHGTPTAYLIESGGHIRRYMDLLIETIARRGWRCALVPESGRCRAIIAAAVGAEPEALPAVVVETGEHCSDVCHRMLAMHPTAQVAVAFYRRKGKGWTYELRSRQGSVVDVGAIARLVGGGGHKHAAGFKSGRALFGDFEAGNAGRTP